MTVFGIPWERVALGFILLLAASACYDQFLVDWLETHKPFVPAQTAIEVVVGVLGVLLVYLLAVQDVMISGIDSFLLLFVYFAGAGPFMALGSHKRTVKLCSPASR